MGRLHANQFADKIQFESISSREREFFIDNLLFRIHVIIKLIRWTGLAP